MSKNVLLCALGVVLGFFVGFLITNAVTKPGAQVASASRSSSSEGSAGPLRPEQMGGELPPGHPDVNGGGGAGSAASTSAEAQAAMERADRSPRDFEAQLEAGRVFYGLRDYPKASLYLERALGLKGAD